MAQNKIKKYNFYRRYKWTADDFTVLQDSLIGRTQNYAEGLTGAAVFEGFTISISGALSLSISSGLASSSSGFMAVKNVSSSVSIDAATGANAAEIRRDLIVVRPTLEVDAVIANPSTPFDSVTLRTNDECNVVVVKGSQGTTADYPTKLDNDIVLAGVSIVPGQTTLTENDLDFSVRDVVGSDSILFDDPKKQDPRLKPIRVSKNVLRIQPSQLKVSVPRGFSYGLNNRPSIFPKTGGELYNHADTDLNFDTGVISGGDQFSPDFTPVIPSSGQAIVACVSLTSGDDLVVSYGTQGTRGQCFDGVYSQKQTGSGSVNVALNSIPICFVIVTSSNGTTVKNIEVIDARSAGGGGSGAVGDYVVDSFSGTGSQAIFTLSKPPGNENNTQVFVSGIYQPKSQYNTSANTLTFLSAPPSGVNNIEVVTSRAIPLNTPGVNTVYTDSIQDEAVTADKIASGAITDDKLANPVVAGAALTNIYSVLGPQLIESVSGEPVSIAGSAVTITTTRNFSTFLVFLAPWQDVDVTSFGPFYRVVDGAGQLEIVIDGFPVPVAVSRPMISPFFLTEPLVGIAPAGVIGVYTFRLQFRIADGTPTFDLNNMRLVIKEVP